MRLRTISGEDNKFPLYFVPRTLMSLLYNLKFLSYTPLYTENNNQNTNLCLSTSSLLVYRNNKNRVKCVKIKTIYNTTSVVH